MMAGPSGTALQHLLIAHEPEVLSLLLHYQAPFVLLRALNRPGCSEILQILLGAELSKSWSVCHPFDGFPNNSEANQVNNCIIYSCERT